MEVRSPSRPNNSLGDIAEDMEYGSSDRTLDRERKVARRFESKSNSHDFSHSQQSWQATSHSKGKSTDSLASWMEREDGAPARVPRDSFREAPSTTSLSRSASGHDIFAMSKDMARGAALAEDERIWIQESVMLKGSGWRKKLAHVLHSSYTDAVVAGVILFNFVLICVDTDSRAERLEDDAHVYRDPSPWVDRGMDCCFAFFATEMIMHMAVEQSKYLTSNWNRFDVFLITYQASEYVIKFIGLHFAGMGALRIIHLARLLRLLRVLRLFSILKEFRRLMYMFAGCFRTIAWSFCLLVLVMTIWGCIFVEVIHPIVLSIADHPTWAGDLQAIKSFETVFMADITLFQTIVAHDRWGYVAVPVIQEAPWTCFVFAGALMTLVFGVLNLIVAVIVDTCAENRAKDFMNKALDLEDEEREEKKVLSKMFRLIDEDGSGAVSWDELKEGAQRVESFRHWLRAVDIDSQDLQQLFSIVDQDGSGTIDPDEFIEAMYRLKNADSKTTTKLIKHLVTRMDKEQRDARSELNEVKDGLLKTSMEQVLTAVKGAIQDSEESLRGRLLDQEIAVMQAIECTVTRAVALAMEASLKATANTSQHALSAAAALPSDSVSNLGRELFARSYTNGGSMRHTITGVSDAKVHMLPSLVNVDREASSARARDTTRVGTPSTAEAVRTLTRSERRCSTSPSLHSLGAFEEPDEDASDPAMRRTETIAKVAPMSRASTFAHRRADYGSPLAREEPHLFAQV